MGPEQFGRNHNGHLGGRNRWLQREQPQHQRPSLAPASNCYLNLNYLKIALICLMCHLIYSMSQVSCQLPDDIQRELNQNLAEQARLQAMRARHQQQIQARTGGGQAKSQLASQTTAAAPKPAHDPNNYSFQQISPPIQYSYYQPYGDLAKAQQPQQTTSGGNSAPPAAAGAQAAQPINFDLNNLNIDLPNLPQPQAQTGPNGAQAAQPVQLAPQFSGAGGLPILQPVAAAQQAPGTFAPAGAQPQVAAGQPQQGPPLTEADFKDITGGENYGAPNDFNQGTNDQGGQQSADDSGAGGSSASDQSDDARLREFGMSDGQADGQRAQAQPRQDSNPMAGMMSGLGDFNPMGNPMGPARARQSAASNRGGFDPFGGDFNPMGGDFGGAFGAPSGGGGGGGGGVRHQSNNNQRQSQSGGDFDFASQPSSSQPEQQGDAAQSAVNGGAPGSLQSLLGNAFPGLAGGRTGSMGLDALARGNNAPESQLDGGGGGGQQARQRTDDGALDIADLGDKADSFSGADLGGFEQPSPQNDQDFNYAAAAEHQPKTVPYPDGGPQFVGSLWALNQPQSLSQVRYNPLPDKGTYQDYPAYQSGGNDFGAVSRVVDETPRARRAAPGRYSQPSPQALAPEHRMELGPGGQFDYAHGPRGSGQADANYESSSLLRDFGAGDDDGDDFVD